MRIHYIIMLFLIPASCAFSITEIMYNPEDGNEWIEGYTDESINLFGMEFSDNLNTDTIECCSFLGECDMDVSAASYFLIVDQDSTIEPNGSLFCVDDNSIGNGLGNSGDEIAFRKDNITLVNTSYNFSVEKGNTISLINNTWAETSPTPWSEYMMVETPPYIADIALFPTIPEEVYTYIDYKMLRIENLNYPDFDEQINVTLSYNISKNMTKTSEGTASLSLKSHSTAAETLFSEIGNYTICGELSEVSVEENTSNNKICHDFQVLDIRGMECSVSIAVGTDKEIYESGDKVTISHMLDNKSFPFEIEYWIEDIFGEKVREKRLTSNTNKKSYTPRTSEKEKAFFVKANLKEIICNNTNTNTLSEKLIVVRGNTEEERPEEKKESEIAIESIRPDIAVFGDTIEIKLRITKGDTSKNSIKIYLKDQKIISQTSLNLYGTNQEYRFIIPLPIQEDCDMKYEDGSYKVIVEGLDVMDEKEIVIEHDQKCFVENQLVIPEKQQEETTNHVTGEIIYNSAGENIKDYSKYLLLSAIIVSIYLWAEYAKRLQ